MNVEAKIDIEMFKVVTRSIAQSDDLEVMATHLAQLMVGALDIKGCTIFALNIEDQELEILASFGLSPEFLNKGPVLSAKSIAGTVKGESVVISDISKGQGLQYPQAAIDEGIRAIVSLPVVIYGKVIGALRLYHRDVWDISEQDLDSLLLLAEIIGLAMNYTRLLNALKSVKQTVGDIHTVWLHPGN
jgi:signal transduction protein with GAF and PtsI domain